MTGLTCRICGSKDIELEVSDSKQLLCKECGFNVFRDSEGANYEEDETEEMWVPNYDR